MQTTAVINLKGGVAKTTTVINMAYLLAEVHQKKVLLIDNDKQGNLSKAFQRYDAEDKNTIARVMLEKNLDVSEVIKKTDYENIDIITANMDLLGANLKTLMDTTRQQQTRFKKILFGVKDKYDYCIIDNPPDINVSVTNALVMANDAIIPIFMDQYSFDGLDILLEQFAEIKEDYNESLQFRCLVTQYQKDEVNNQGIAWLKHHNYPLFNQVIRRIFD